MLSKLIVTLIIVIPLFIFSCSESSTGPEDEFGKISGAITFIGSWPENGEVQVSAWTSWPPAGPPTAFSDAFTPGTIFQNYALEGLSKGIYDVITVGWRNPDNPADAKVLGIYWLQTDSLGVDSNGYPTVTPVSIDVSSSKMKWKNIDIIADLDIIP